MFFVIIPLQWNSSVLVRLKVRNVWDPCHHVWKFSTEFRKLRHRYMCLGLGVYNCWNDEWFPCHLTYSSLDASIAAKASPKLKPRPRSFLRFGGSMASVLFSSIFFIISYGSFSSIFAFRFLGCKKAGKVFFGAVSKADSLRNSFKIVPCFLFIKIVPGKISYTEWFECFYYRLTCNSLDYSCRVWLGKCRFLNFLFHIGKVTVVFACIFYNKYEIIVH